MSETCKWEREDDDKEVIYNTQCDNIHVFFAGNCKENDYLFCPYCGKEIQETE